MIGITKDAKHPVSIYSYLYSSSENRVVKCFLVKTFVFIELKPFNAKNLPSPVSRMKLRLPSTQNSQKGNG